MQGWKKFNIDFSRSRFSMRMNLFTFRPILNVTVRLSYLPTLLAQIKYYCNKQSKIMLPWKLYDELSVFLRTVISTNSEIFTKLWFLLFTMFSGTWAFFQAVDCFQCWQDFHVVKWKCFTYRSQKASLRFNYTWHISTNAAVTTVFASPAYGSQEEKL